MIKNRLGHATLPAVELSVVLTTEIESETVKATTYQETNFILK